MVANPKIAEQGPRTSKRAFMFLLLLVLLFSVVLFLFWRNSSLGRALSDKQISEYLHDTKDPHHVQDALAQVGDRMQKHETDVSRWYPDLVGLTSSPVEEIRNTDARVMGLDPSVQHFHQALLKLLTDSSPSVRGNAALSLVNFGDATGRPQIIELLKPAVVTAPVAGKIVDAGAIGTAVRQDGLVARLDANGEDVQVRAPISGRVEASNVKMGQIVAAGREIATIDPEGEQVWQGLHALAQIGQAQDLPLVQHYERSQPYIPKRVREQAEETEKAIRGKAQ